MFHVSHDALRQIQQAASDSGASDLALRVAARRLADGSVDYAMGFDAVKDDDTQLQFDSVAVVIAPHHLSLLQDIELDFVTLQPGQNEFIFVNPNADTAASGCGSGAGCGSACASRTCGA